MYEFKQEYLAGIRMIDEEHKKLFEIANTLHNLQQEELRIDKYDEIKEVLSELKNYTNYHFDHEEAYMESIGYKHMFMQKIQHDQLRNRMEEWELDNIDEDQEGTIDQILIMITDWLVNHILELDKKIEA